jgi:Fe-S cluster biogenesis protein NfuA
MSSDDIRITAEPQTNMLCIFTVDRPVYPEASFFFADASRADGSPLAARLFAVPGVTSVLISHDQITIGQPGHEDWRTIGPQIGAAIREHLTSGEPAVGDELRQSLPPADEIRSKVQKVLDAEINPAVAQHGGSVQLIDVRDNNVFIQMGGGCQGCGMARMTLRNGVETAIRRNVPEVGGIFDTTDHAAGSNPYYAKTE